MPSHLMHYTDVEGLEGILNENEIWATRYDFLNDAAEAVFAKNIILDNLPSKIQNVPEEEGKFWKNINIEDRISSIYDEILGQSPPYIASLANSDNEDVLMNGTLEMWRGYHGAYAVVFEKDQLNEYFDLKKEIKEEGHNIAMYNVMYGEDQIKQKIGTLWNIVKNLREHKNSEVTEQNFDQDFSKMLRDIIVSSKNPAFKAEKEIRIVATPNDDQKDTTSQIFFRKTREILTPSYKLRNLDGKKIPIHSIIVGPGRDTNLKIRGLSLLLKKLGRTIEVRASNIPFRN